MCIMYIKDYDQEFPTDETMKICWDDNRDGAGYSWYDKAEDMWHTVKGLMSWNEFLDKFNDDRQVFGLDRKTVIVHFRVGTSGPEVGGATHPFPAVKTEGVDVNTLRYTSKGVFFHNGTIGFGSNGLSDTQIACMDMVQPMVRHIFEDRETDEDLLDILCDILKVNNNRYVITHGNRIRYLGKWEKDENGIVFSNNRYKEANTRYVAAAAKAKEQKEYLADLREKHQVGDGYLHNSSSCTVIDLPERIRDVAVFMDEKGFFDWSLWDNRYNLKTDTKTVQTIEVFDRNGDLKYTVERDKGDVEPWDETMDTEIPVEGTVTCLSCNLFVKPTDLISGECPGCGTMLDPDGFMNTDNSQRDYECPTCDAQMSIEYVEDEGRMQGLMDYCQCWECRCVWGYPIEGDSPWIIGYLDSAGKLVKVETPTAKEA